MSLILEDTHQKDRTKIEESYCLFFSHLHGELVYELRKGNVDMDYNLIYAQLSHLFPMKNCMPFNEVQELSF